MKKAFLIIFSALCICAVNRVTAQVIIGSTVDPQPFSILELDGGGERGLRLPQLNASQQQALTVELTGLTDQAKKNAARGLQIFNTKTKCVETWNGTKWIEQCGEPDPWVEIAIPVCLDIDVPPVRFAKYNLGADPQYDTPKKQMKYLAEHAFDKLDAHIYGGFFQWGRKWDKTSDATSYPVSVENNTYRRYHSDEAYNDDVTNHVAKMGAFTLANDYDSSGQPNSTHAGNHLYDYFNNNFNDWLKLDKNLPNDPSLPIYYDAELGMSPNRWGNGVALGTPTPEGVRSTDGNYYQSTKWVHSENDPCPDGFRVPTQDEWERLCDYDCNSGSSGGNIITGNVSGTPTGKGLTWVPVVCNIVDYPGRCFPSISWETNITASSGYAIYETAEWEKAITTGGVYAEWAGSGNPTTDNFNIKEGNNYKYPSLHEEATAPEPLLFLPAAGYRYFNNGKVLYTGEHGFYWSSTVYNISSYYIYFYSDMVNPKDCYTVRAYEYSIRCVVE